ncbi:hypothetical protein B5C26_07035 [Photorhabdus luminescens]|uniref:HAD-IIA family hydrolase n=1 Tax=Photorhabdus luminescens TaxID=29488 RepID=UPI000B4C9B11|nr:HAD-IIA family hydrolase [Photorhabdus luminescens]OWO83349.1 hypothetical protein B5C26_07035 [Photorhabdus luminescens]
MLGIILAAGVGSRLRPMTNSKPKCLVTTAGKTILQYQLDAYRKADIKDIIIIVGYEGNKIVEYCKHIKDLNISIIHNEIYEDSNNMYSFYLAKGEAYGRSFILNNADLSIDNNIICDLVKSNKENLIAVDVGLYNDESMKISVNEDGFIKNIAKNLNKDESLGCSIDFYKFSAASSKIFFDEISSIIEIEKNLKDWTEVAMQRLFANERLKFEVLNINGKDWVEIDNYIDLSLSDKIFSQKEKKISEFKNYIFDLDGTIYVGNKIIKGAADKLEELKSKGKNVRFLSNNSSKNKDEYKNKLANYGIECDKSEIILSTDILINFLKNNRVHKVYVLGTKSLQTTIINAGLEICTHKPEYVILGYDTELTYSKLVTAFRLLNKNVDLIATHCDNYCPSEVGPIPDIGALLALIKATNGVEPKYIFGKPSSLMIDSLCEIDNFNKEETIIIGDRLHTDIKMAQDSGIASLLVLSGETSRDIAESSNIKPQYILNDVSEIDC